MKILGLFVVVLMVVLTGRAIGFSEGAQLFGAIVSASSFAMMTK